MQTMCLSFYGILDGGPDSPWDGTILGNHGNVDLKLLYAIFRQADSMQSLTLTLTLAYNNLRSTFPVMPNFEGGGEMPFGMLSQLDPRNHVLAGVQITDEKRQF